MNGEQMTFFVFSILSKPFYCLQVSSVKIRNLCPQTWQDYRKNSHQVWWVCVCRSQLSRNAGKSPSSKFSTLRVSSFLSWSTFKSTRLDTVMSGAFSMFREKSLWSRLWNTLFGPRPDDPVKHLTAILTLGITTLSIVVKMASWTRRIINLSPDSIGNISFIYLIETCSDFTGCGSHRFNNKTISLRLCTFNFSNLCIGDWCYYQSQNHLKIRLND